MERDLDGRLLVRTRLLPGPCLWCWEIVDAFDGDVIESSSAGGWSGYASRHEAMSAGLARLLEKTRGARARRAPGRPAPGRAAMSSPADDTSSLERLLRPRRCLLVVPRSKLELYLSLKRSFADNDRVEVILDRRFAQRRRAATTREPERRRAADRRVRTATEAELRAGRWTLVPVAGSMVSPHARPA
jgi:hypothetical protein